MQIILPGDGGLNAQALAVLGPTASTQPEVPLLRRRYTVLAGSGVGKTWLFSTMPQTLIIDTEDSLKEVPAERRRAAYVSCLTYADVAAVCEKLLAAKAKRPVEHVVFDTATRYVKLIIDAMTADLNDTSKPKDTWQSVTDYGRGGKGWDMVKTRFLRYPLELYAAGYGVTLAAHLDKKITEDNTALTTVTLSKTFKSALLEFCDMFGMLTREEKTEYVPGPPMVLPSGVKVPQMTAVRVCKYQLLYSQPLEEEARQDFRLKNRLMAPATVDVTDGWDSWRKAVEAARAKPGTGAVESTGVAGIGPARPGNGQVDAGK